MRNGQIERKLERFLHKIVSFGDPDQIKSIFPLNNPTSSQLRYWLWDSLSPEVVSSGRAAFQQLIYQQNFNEPSITCFSTPLLHIVAITTSCVKPFEDNFTSLLELIINRLLVSSLNYQCFPVGLQSLNITVIHQEMIQKELQTASHLFRKSAASWVILKTLAAVITQKNEVRFCCCGFVIWLWISIKQTRHWFSGVKRKLELWPAPVCLFLCACIRRDRAKQRGQRQPRNRDSVGSKHCG